MVNAASINLELTTRDGATVRSETYDSIEDLKADWPYAEEVSEGEFTVWIGSKS